MADVTLTATRRSVMGKQVRALRRQGLIPANVYGRGIESIPLQFDLRDLRDVLMQAGATTVVDLHIRGADGREDGGRHPVLIDNIQRNAGTGKILHVDFRQVDLNLPVRASVPLVLTGESPAAERGAVVVQALDTLEVEALPGDLPQEIAVDISGLVDTTSQVAVGELAIPAGVTAHADPATVVVSVVASRVEEEVAAEEAAAAEAAAEEAAVAEAAEEAAPAEGAEEPAAPEESGEPGESRAEGEGA
jgi:large subunit ribosomal protein L25